MSFNNMGKKIPAFKKERADQHLREMNPALTAEQRLDLISKVAYDLEKDNPHKPMDRIQRGEYRGVLDLTGMYRLFAVLLADYEPADELEAATVEGPFDAQEQAW